jgi:hypothetical protein
VIVYGFKQIRRLSMDTIKSGNENSIREKCRKIIKDEFFPARGDGKFRY